MSVFLISITVWIKIVPWTTSKYMFVRHQKLPQLDIPAQPVCWVSREEDPDSGKSCYTTHIVQCAYGIDIEGEQLQKKLWKTYNCFPESSTSLAPRLAISAGSLCSSPHSVGPHSCEHGPIYRTSAMSWKCCHCNLRAWFVCWSRDTPCCGWGLLLLATPTPGWEIQISLEDRWVLDRVYGDGIGGSSGKGESSIATTAIRVSLKQYMYSTHFNFEGKSLTP